MIILGLGCNVENRLKYLETAISLLGESVLKISSISPIYESEALLKPGAPPEWNAQYLNMAISGTTSLSPHELLSEVKSIEQKIGRQHRGIWAPREIDIDILVYNDLEIREENLTIPHTGLFERAFALLPLADIAPNFLFKNGKTAHELANDLPNNNGTIKTSLKINNKTKIVGILNITPDSFSDGGLAGNLENIIASAVKLIKDGADVIDIGAESTRPGATTLTPEEEWARLGNCLPKICVLAKTSGVLTSIDTRNSQTAKRAIECGIDWVNDVSGVSDDSMMEILKSWRGKIVVMHNLGVPADKNIIIPEDKNVVTEVYNWLEARLQLLEKAGIARSRIILDPGIGFGKNAEQSWELINNISTFKKLGAEILVGHSRKSFLGATIDERDEKTLEVSKQLISDGVDYLRVHNVSLHKTSLI